MEDSVTESAYNFLLLLKLSDKQSIVASELQ